MVLFLCSDAALYVTGQTYLVDGGHTVRGLLPVENTAIREKCDGGYGPHSPAVEVVKIQVKREENPWRHRRQL